VNYDELFCSLHSIGIRQLFLVLAKMLLFWSKWHNALYKPEMHWQVWCSWEVKVI